MARLLAMAGVLAVSAIALVACGGSDEPSKEDYAEEVTSVANPLGEELQRLSETSGSQEAVVNAYAQAEDQLGDAVQQLKEIEPPEDVAALHDRLVSEVSDYQAATGKAHEAAQAGDAAGINEFIQASTAFATAMTALSQDFRDAGVPFEAPGS